MLSPPLPLSHQEQLSAAAERVLEPDPLVNLLVFPQHWSHVITAQWFLVLAQQRFGAPSQFYG